MRILGLTLVVGSLVLGSGGVALRTHAAAAPGEQFGTTSVVPLEQEQLDEGSCSVQADAGSRPEPKRLQLPRRKSDSKLINLSNRGFNYRGGGVDPKHAAPANPRD